MKFVRIHEGFVAEIFDRDPQFHPAVQVIQAPNSVALGWLLKDGALAEPLPDIEQIKLERSAAMRAACAVAITSGFTSSALGEPHTYPSDQTDQSNLSANVLSSMYPNLPDDWTTLHLCGDSEGHWGYKAHTAAQIQQVGSDSKTAILACLTRNAVLQAQIEAADDIAAIQQTIW